LVLKAWADEAEVWKLAGQLNREVSSRLVRRLAERRRTKLRC